MDATFVAQASTVGLRDELAALLGRLRGDQECSPWRIVADALCAATIYE